MFLVFLIKLLVILFVLLIILGIFFINLKSLTVELKGDLKNFTNAYKLPSPTKNLANPLVPTKILSHHFKPLSELNASPISPKPVKVLSIPKSAIALTTCARGFIQSKKVFILSVFLGSESHKRPPKVARSIRKDTAPPKKLSLRPNKPLRNPPSFFLSFLESLENFTGGVSSFSKAFSSFFALALSFSFFCSLLFFSRAFISSSKTNLITLYISPWA